MMLASPRNVKSSIAYTGTGAGAVPIQQQISTVIVQDNDPILIGVSRNIPLAFFDEEDKPQGIFIDILDAIAKAEGWDIAYVFCEWSDCLSSLESGQIQLIAAIAYSDERAAQFDFNTEAIFTNWGQVDVHKDSDIQSILDLNGKRVALNPDHIHTPAFLNLTDEFDIQIEIIESENFNQSLQMVHEGEADAAVTNRLQSIFVENELDIQEAPIVFNPVNIKIAATKGQHEALLAAIDQHLVLMKADPSSVYYQSLSNWIDYFGRPLPQQQTPSWIRPVILTFLALLALFVCFTLLLRQQVRVHTRQLSQSESQLRAIFENSGDAIAVTKANEHVIVNDAYLEMFGYSSLHDLAYVPLLIAPQAREEFRHYLQQYIQGLSTPDIYETRGLRRDGSEFDMQTRISIYELEKVVYTVILARDITRQKQAKLALQKSERILAVAQSIAKLGSWEWNAVTNNVFFSDEMYAILGLDKQVILSMQFIEGLVHPDDMLRYQKWQEHPARSAGGGAIELQIVRADGATRIVSMMRETVYDNAGNLTGAIGTLQDVTEKRATETHLRQLSRVVEQSSLSVIITNLTGEIEYVNPAFLQATGYQFEEIVGQIPKILQPGQTNPGSTQQLLQTITSGRIWRGELLNKKKDGQPFWESVSISAVFDDHGNIINYLSIQEDITAYKEIQTQLGLWNRELQMLNRATQSIGSTLELDKILKIMLQEIKLLFDVTECSVWLLEAETGDLVCQHVADPTATALLHYRLPPGKGLAGWVASNGQSLLIHDAGQDRRHQNNIDEQLGQAARSMLVVPLRIQHKITGILQVVDKMPNRFTQRDLQLMESLAAFAVNAIENAQLHQNLQTQLETLKQTQNRMIQSERLAAIGELIAGIAHELNNPLASVVLYSQLAQSRSLDDRLKHELEQIVSQANRASGIVQGLLDFARQRPSERKIVQINEVLRATLKLLEYELRTHNIQVESRLDADLPLLSADPQQWQQVFVNLINN
ncbi:MAG: PAS domain S-box protein, partial [Anaerolineales bacterium]|nr:PAS domain S-box protein [Anaerolineales bacterium]